MPLPSNGTTWPPPHMAAVYREMARDAMWYEGNPHRLARAADRREHTPRRADQDTRRSRSRWGRQSADYPRKRERRLHVPLPGDIATVASDLLFADMPAITATTTDTTGHLADAIDTTGMHSLLLGAAEQASAMSGIFLRLIWDREIVPDRPIPTTVQPDNAIPEYAFGILRGVTFWRELAGGDTQTVYRHLERHEPGRIEHALYEGTPDNLGRAVPLTEHTETAALVASLDADGVSVETGIPMLTAVYVPNMTPNRQHRASPYGRSDYAAPIHDQFEALDDVWTSWLRDIRLARARLVVPDAYLTNLGPGQGAAWDDDREVYSGLNVPPTDTGAGLTLAQFKIRVDEHQRTAEAITRKAVESAGYSAQSFGLEGGGEAITATEVDSRDGRSTTTTKKKAGHWKAKLADFLYAYQLLAVAQFGARIEPERPTVEFRLDATESEQSKATTLELYARAGAISTMTKVKYRSPDLDDREVDDEVARILAETGAGAPDPGDTYPM
ncbi:phage capsid protein [Streptomyces salyersiae]|uniref:Phage capsid protein n=1 Tax=Streptomyces salyersiae TaxID=3075530 RepID=A0ABU2RVD3_9ACTN|nr:phage capsid protein [Streptomyces sp. DSM 41770]MDT0432796.1 phage capsid protein [Streptomyces sp. DSM 41770]